MAIKSINTEQYEIVNIMTLGQALKHITNKYLDASVDRHVRIMYNFDLPKETYVTLTEVAMHGADDSIVVWVKPLMYKGLTVTCNDEVLNREHYGHRKVMEGKLYAGQTYPMIGGKSVLNAFSDLSNTGKEIRITIEYNE